jgi:hypothetical protein
MPVINDLIIGLDLAEAENLRAIRGNNRIHPRMLAMLPEILAEISTGKLINPAAGYRIIEVKQVKPGRMELHDGTIFAAPILTHRLARASALAVGVITIGRAISEAISGYFSTGENLKAILMEEIANALLFKTSDHFQDVIDNEAARLGLQASGQLAPGNEGFDFTQQPQVLALAGAERVGISLSATGLMDPVHSTSVLIGIGKRMPRWSQFESCQSCPSRDKCVHRKESNTVAACV